MTSITDVIKKLEVIFDKANEKFYGNKLIRPIITIQTGKRSVLGWCSSGKSWIDNDNKDSYYEINIVAENLARPLKDIVATMLHEMVHLYNSQRGVDDCTRTQYHNKHFKDAALEHGLAMVNKKADFNRGYSYTKLNDLGDKFVQELIDGGMGDLSLNRGPLDQTPRTPKAGNKVYVYKCPHCGTTIRSSNSELNIICGDCNFKLEIQTKK